MKRFGIPFLGLLCVAVFLGILLPASTVHAGPCDDAKYREANPTECGGNPNAVGVSNPGGFKLQNPIKYPSIDAFLLQIVTIVVQYGALLVVFFIVYAGFQFVTAQGNTEKLASAKKTLVWVIVGAFVLLGVYVLKAAICGTLQQISADPTKPLCTP